jgi:hypothetical protein
VSATNKLVTVWRDYRGQIAKLTLFVAAAVVDPSGVAVQAVRDALALISTAVNTRASLTFTDIYAGAAAVTGPYQDDQDKLALTFRSVNNTTHTFLIPAPLAAMFDTDNPDELDYTNVDLDALIDSLLALATTPDGDAMDEFLFGERRRLKAGGAV